MYCQTTSLYTDMPYTHCEKQNVNKIYLHTLTFSNSVRVSMPCKNT